MSTAATFPFGFKLDPISCFACDGGGRQGFMGVAIVPCSRCSGSGVDPNPTEEDAHRFNNPPIYRASSEPEEGSR